MNKQTITVEFSIKSLLLVIATLAGLWVAYLLKDILLTIFVAFILTSSIEPLALYLKRFRIPRALSMAIAYIGILALFVALGFMVIPPLVSQLDGFIKQLPDVATRAATIIAGNGADQQQIQDYINTATNYLASKAESLSSSALEVGLGVVSGIFTIITIVVISFYILLEKTRMYESLELIITPKRYQVVRPVIDRIEARLGAWMRGQLLLGLIIGLTTWVGLEILRIPYALPLAIIAGIMELVPLVGPMLSAIPTIIVALTISPTMAAAVVLLYIIIQQVESNFVVPKVMSRAVGLNPFFVLVAILAGAALMGIIGALLAIPIAVVLATILEELPDRAASQPAPSKSKAK